MNPVRTFMEVTDMFRNREDCFIRQKKQMLEEIEELCCGYFNQSSRIRLREIYRYRVQRTGVR